MDISSYIKPEEFSKLMQEIDNKRMEPKPQDPTLPQIPGYAHYMDDSTTHKIEKNPPYLTEEDEKFVPITFPESRRKERYGWYRNQVFEGVTKYLLAQHPEEFNRIVELEIREVSEISNGFEQTLKGLNKIDYMYLRKKWDISDVHLFVGWKAKYKFLKNKSKRDDVKMSDLTLGPEGYASGSATVKDTKEESRGTRSESGEIVVSFPAKEYSNLSRDVAIDYIAVLGLAGKKLKVEIDGKYITSTGVVLWKDQEMFHIDEYIQELPEKALSKANDFLLSVQEEAKAGVEQAKEELKKTLEDTKGIYAQRRKELENKLKNLQIKVRGTWNNISNFATEYAAAPATSVVTTPTGPGVAINVVMAVINTLKSFAKLIKISIEEIENLLVELEFDKYAPLIPGVNGAYVAIKNLLSLAKTTISLVGV
jgi:hypothetical protein